MAEEKKAEEKKAEEAKAEEGVEREVEAEDKDAKIAAEAEVKQKLEVYDRIDNLYRTNPDFKEAFDALIAGKKLTVAEKKAIDDANIDVGAEDGDSALDKLDQSNKETVELKAKLSEVEAKLDQLTTNFINDKVGTERLDIDNKYNRIFSEMAEERGFVPGSNDFEFLKSKLKDEIVAKAAKRKMVDENGNVDLLRKYDASLMKDAFEAVYNKFKESGYDEAMRKRKLLLQRKNLLEKEKNKYNKYIDKDKVKTLDGRVEIVRRFFQDKLTA